LKDKYALEFFELGINLGLEGVENVGDTGVLSGDGVELVERADCEEADEETGENDGLHDILDDK
jgi:hypothetical protein